MNENQIHESIVNNKEKLITYMSYYLSTLNEAYIEEIKQILDDINLNVKAFYKLEGEDN